MATGSAGPPLPGVPVTAMSSMPTHSSAPGGVGGDDADLDDRLVVGRPAGSDDGDGVTAVAAAGRGVGDVAAGQVGEVAGRADAVLQGDLLDGVVGTAVDVAHVVGDGDVDEPGRGERQHQVRSVGGARALQGDDRVGDGELGDAAGAERVGLVWLAMTSTTERALAEHVCGSAPVRRPGRRRGSRSTPGTPAQSSSVVISAGVGPAWADGSASGVGVGADRVTHRLTGHGDGA